MYIPQSGLTYTQVETAWRESEDGQLPIINTLLSAGAAGGGFPYYNPGGGSDDITESPRYPDTLQAVPYSVSFPGAVTSGNRVYYYDDDGKGLSFAKGIGVYYNLTTGAPILIYTSGYNLYLGPTYDYPVSIFTTLDNYVGIYRIGINRRNSSLFFFSEVISNNIITWLYDLPDASLDPYEKGGISETGGIGGTGNFDGTSDSIDFPSLPSLSAVDTGLVSLYAPTLAQINSLANYLWSNDFDLDTFKKLLYDPMDVIIGMSIIPVTPPVSAVRAVGLGNLVSTVTMPVAASQYVAVDCGILNVNEYWGAFLDYSPYTKVQIFLPYIGIRQLDIDDVMGKAVHLKYHIDILTGGCTAMLKCGDSVLYTFGGQCAINIPVSSADWTNTIQGLLQTVSGIVAGAAAGGAVGAVAGGIMTASNAIMQGDAKPTVHRSGALSGSNGILGIQTPYMILTRPRQAVPARQNEIMGYPSNIYAVIGSLTGYTQIEQVHLVGIPGTEQEIAEIERLLKEGVIL